MPFRVSEEWLARYASLVIERKRLSGKEAEAAILRTARVAFSRVYRAVAFDIDGTLTPYGGLTVDRDAAQAVSALLQRGVHVFLVTGRGTDSTIEAAEQIRNVGRLSDWYVRRLSCVILNGVSLLTTDSGTPNSFLRASRDLCPPLECLDELLAAIEKSLKPEVVKISKKRHSVRIELRDPSQLESVQSALKELVQPFAARGAELHLSVGRYGAVESLSIASTTKKQALEEVAALYGIPADNILRIGDQGQRGGNDFELLDSPAGFSVGDVSDVPTGCLPVVDVDSGQALRAADATYQLMSRVLLFPSISMSPRWTDQQTTTLLTFEKLALARSREENETVTQRLRVRLRYLIGSVTSHGPTSQLHVDHLFDPRSGAVRFRDWELHEAGGTTLAAQFFERRSKDSSKAPNFVWSMASDTGRLMRGPRYYFALSASIEGKAISVPDYVAGVEELLIAAINALGELEGLEPDLALFKFLVSFADNIRNALITLVYAAHCTAPRLPCSLARDMYGNLVVPHTQHHFELLLDPDWTWRNGLGRYIAHLNEVLTHVRSLSPELIEQAEVSIRAGANPSDILRRWREADHFLQNVAAVQLGLHEFQQRGDLRSRPVVACGLLYGGTELPAIAEVLGKRRGVTIESALIRLSLYGNPGIGDKIRRGDAAYVDEYVRTTDVTFVRDGTAEFRDHVAILLDDNTTTGATLQLARDAVVVKGGDVTGIIVVGFPGSNRIAQMSMPDHGFVDPDLLFGFIRGLVAPSPYARLLFPMRTGNRDEVYLDQTREFNKAKSRIERYLKKNSAEDFDA